jgi:hypothetical protein
VKLTQLPGANRGFIKHSCDGSAAAKLVIPSEVAEMLGVGTTQLVPERKWSGISNLSLGERITACFQMEICHCNEGNTNILSTE